MRVLLIEDDASIAQSIELMLKSENFNTYTTDLGEEGVDLGKLQDEDEKKAAEESATAFKPVLDKLKEALKARAKDVRTTTRLVDSPACIVVEEGDMSSHLARLLKQSGQAMPGSGGSKPILEVNPEHALVKRLESSADGDGDGAADGQSEDPAAYVRRVNRLLMAA